MKNFSLLIVLLLSVLFINAQSPRLVLHEEFTSSTCGPCAGANPTFHTWLTQHPDVFTEIFYHVNWPSPGNDPMYLQNPLDNGARVSFYGINYVPQAVVDGNYWQGNGASLQWSTITARAAMPSPFTIALQHYLNTAQDSIFLTMVATATQNIQSGMVAQNVVIEKHIHFNTAPGTNGEKDFYNVMKKMLPTNAGTGLPTTFANGDYIIIETAWKLANVYDNTQLAAVSFIQNATTKEIYQTANSTVNPIVLPYNTDLQVMEISNVSAKNCSGKITPEVKIRNNGNNTITGFQVKYKVNNEPIATYTWSGSITSLQKAIITLPEYTFAPQADNILKIYSTDPNSTSDQYPKNDTLSIPFAGPDYTSNVLYLFLRTDSNPQETTWDVKNSNGTVIQSHGPYTVPNHTAKDTITLGVFDCYTFTVYDSGNNGLCCTHGNGGYELDDSQGGAIKTGGSFISSDFIEFDYYAEGLSGNLIAKDPLMIYPNPFDEKTTVSFYLKKDEKVQISLYNMVGQCLKSFDLGTKAAGHNEFIVNSEDLQSGIYFIRLQEGASVYTEKVAINK